MFWFREMSRKRIICLGDSITQQASQSKGWLNIISDHYVREFDFVNRGFSGYNTRWILGFAFIMFFFVFLFFQNCSNKIRKVKENIKKRYIFLNFNNLLNFLNNNDGVQEHFDTIEKDFAGGSLATILFGANDSCSDHPQHVPLEQFEQNLNEIIARHDL